jgi:hypothetical protein
MNVSYDGMPPDEYDEDEDAYELLAPVRARAARIAEIERLFGIELDGDPGWLQ